MDVVVPFRGNAASLEALRGQLKALRLQPGDSLLVVDNTPGHTAIEEGEVPVLHAAEIPTPAFARNRGVAHGSAEWLVFLDADVVPAPDLLDRYFDPRPPSGRASSSAESTTSRCRRMAGRPRATPTSESK